MSREEDIAKAANYYSDRQLWAIATFGKKEQCGENGKVIHVGCVGCGKTTALTEGLGLYCADLKSRGYTNLKLLLAGRTESTIMNNVGTPLKKLFGPNFKYSSRLIDGIRRDAILFDQNLIFVKLGDKNAMQSITGISDIIGCYHDEAQYCSEEQYRLLQDRIRGEYSLLVPDLPDNYVRGFYIASTNPAGPKHHLKQKIDNGILKEVHWYASEVRYPYFKEYFKGRMKEYRYNRQAWGRNIQGLWTQQDGLVYKSFNAKRNTLKITNYDLTQAARTFIGIDYGGSETHYSTVIFGAKDRTGRYVILSEWGIKGEDATTSKIAMYVSNLMRQVEAECGKYPTVYVDPSHTATKNELKAWNITPVNAYNEHAGGIGIIESGFALGNIIINTDCHLLLDEIQMYRYKENNANDDVVRVDKDATNSYHDDFVDAMRYAIASDTMYNK